MKLSLPLYEPLEVEIGGTAYKVKPANLELFRRLNDIEKRNAALPADDPDTPIRLIESSYEVLQVLVDAPAEVLSAMPIDLAKEMVALIKKNIVAGPKATGAEDEAGKNVSRPGDGTAVS